MSNLAIIPARGGSKRIPGKNIKDFLGKPIIAYPIETALKSGLFDEVMVSTDDPNIAEIALSYGASVPFMRSADNSGDYATTVEVILEVIEQYEDVFDKSFKYGCCIYPATPLVSSDVLIQGYERLKSSGFSTIFPVVSYSHPIWRGLRVKADGTLAMIWAENAKARTQDLEAAYHDAGQWYWFVISALRQDKSIWTKRTGAFIVDELFVQDIDNESDWQLAELKYELLQSLQRNSLR